MRCRHPMRLVLAACMLAMPALAMPASVSAAISVTDDAARTVTLPHPAQRIVSLAPHATEMLFAAGAGSRVVGVVDYSDYPPQAKQIASVGSGIALDLERILQLRPDLIVAWRSGNSSAQIARLEQLGIPVFESEPRDFDTIASSLERLAHLAGTDAVGERAARAFRMRLQRLNATYSRRPAVSVFYQIWQAPLMTLNGKHLVSRALQVCGGKNIFGDLPQLTPTVGIEAVVKADPDAIVVSQPPRAGGFSVWRRFPAMKAVSRGDLFSIDGSLLNRSGPRILDGVEALCRDLDTVRRRR